MLDFLKKENKENNDGKITEKDLGLIEDTFGFLTDATSFEDHCINSFISTSDENCLKDLNWMRNMRTYYLNLISENCVGNDWCRLKHLCRIAKGLQEDCSRFLSMNDLEKAKKCAEDYKETYLKFLELIKADTTKINKVSSA